MSRARQVTLYVTAALFAALFVRLGLWQLDRRAQRVATERAIDERGARPALDWAGAATDPAVIPRDTSGTVWRRVAVTGRYDREREIVLRGRALRGSPGVEVLTPLRTAGGAVLVLRGFLPAADALRPDLGDGWPAGRSDSALVTVEGRLLPARSGSGGNPIRLALDGREHLVLAGADLGAIEAELPYPVLPYVIRAEDDGLAVATLGPPREIERGTGPHLSYAIQWFSFAVIALVGTVALARKERGRRHPPLGVVAR